MKEGNVITVIMLTGGAGPKESWQPGTLRTVSALEASELVAGNYAAYATPEAKTAYRLRNREVESSDWNDGL